MSKHFKNQASKRRRDGYRRHGNKGIPRLVDQIFNQSAEIVRLKSENKTLQFDNNVLLGKVREGNRIIGENQIIHDSIVKELGKKLNKTVRSRNMWCTMFWSYVTCHITGTVVWTILQLMKD